MSQASYEIKENQVREENYRKYLEFKGERHFSGFDMDVMIEKIKELKVSRWYYYASGFAVGCIATILIIHFTK